MRDVLSRFRQAVDVTLQQVWAAPPPFALRASSSLADDFLAPAIALTAGGKRTRALFALAGFQTGLEASPATFSEIPTAELPVYLGASLELYQLSALIHDDVIDAAATRRGIATAHEAYAAWHTEHHLLGSREDFGEKMAILLGDYVLSLAAYVLEQGLASDPLLRPEAANKVRELFHSMCTEVAFGQYTDALSEFQPLESNSAAAIDQALSVLYHKAARYSVSVPTLLGAELAMARRRPHHCATVNIPSTPTPQNDALTDTTTPNRAGSESTLVPHSPLHEHLTGSMNAYLPRDVSILAELERICQPLGEAFQLRDDALGIFGDPQTTGKPAGGDLSEGKRTVLLALTRAAAPPHERAMIDALIGRPLSEEDLTTARTIIRDCGAYDQHEAMIAEREAAVTTQMGTSRLELSVLEQLADDLTQRTY